VRLSRHPFGIHEADLRRLMDRRSREYAHALAEADSRRERLMSANAQRRRYLALLQDELAALQADEQRLKQMLTATPAESAEAELASGLAAMQAQLDQTRALAREIARSVFQLISPCLDHGPATLDASHKGGEI
jgi:DNA repair exonuclease SbcCD ATPase subunit